MSKLKKIALSIVLLVCSNTAFITLLAYNNKPLKLFTQQLLKDLTEQDKTPIIKIKPKEGSNDYKFDLSFENNTSISQYTIGNLLNDKGQPKSDDAKKFFDQLGLTTDKEGKYKTGDISAVLQVAPDFKPKWQIINDEIIFAKGEVNVYFRGTKEESKLLINYEKSIISAYDLERMVNFGRIIQTSDIIDDDFFLVGANKGQFYDRST